MPKYTRRKLRAPSEREILAIQLRLQASAHLDKIVIDFRRQMAALERLHKEAERVANTLDLAWQTA